MRHAFFFSTSEFFGWLINELNPMHVMPHIMLFLFVPGLIMPIRTFISRHCWLPWFVCFSSSPIGLLYLKIALFDQVELSSFQGEILEVKEEKNWICIQGSCLFILISMVLMQSQCTLDKPLYARIFTYDSLHKRSL